jgi:hypothetical protein
LTPTDSDLSKSVHEAFGASKPLPYRAGKSSFPLFGAPKSEGPRLAPPKVGSGTHSASETTRTNAGSRNGGLTEAELMRRRRAEAVYGMATESVSVADDHSAEYYETHDTGFRW